MPSKSEKTELKELVLLMGLSEVSRIGICDRIFDEEDLITLMTILEIIRYTGLRNAVPKSIHWLETVLPDLDDKRFRSQVRMRKQAFCDLLLLLKENSVFSDAQIPLPIQLAVALFQFGTFGNAAAIGQIATKFGISEGTVKNIMSRVTSALVSIEQDWVKWPSKEERQNIGSELAHHYLPKCVGFVDGSDAVLSHAPIQDKEVYWSRKKMRYAIQFQVVCDVSKCIRHLFCGFPGSVHDAKVYSTTDLSRSPEKYFTDGEYLIGDSAYTTTEKMVVPYKRYRPLLSKEILFNQNLSSLRVLVEHTIGILKGRFQSLKNLRLLVDNISGHKKACRWIQACVILHNILTVRDPWTQSLDEMYLEPENDSFAQPDCLSPSSNGELKRAALVEIISAMIESAN